MRPSLRPRVTREELSKVSREDDGRENSSRSSGEGLRFFRGGVLKITDSDKIRRAHRSHDVHCPRVPPHAFGRMLDGIEIASRICGRSLSRTRSTKSEGTNGRNARTGNDTVPVRADEY